MEPDISAAAIVARMTATATTDLSEEPILVRPTPPVSSLAAEAARQLAERKPPAEQPGRNPPPPDGLQR